MFISPELVKLSNKLLTSWNCCCNDIASPLLFCKSAIVKLYVDKKSFSFLLA